MKKGLLLVLAVLLVAGLFVSCNSDVSANAGASSKDYAYVTFDKASASKSVSPTVDPADAPSIDDLYWYYQAIKASGTVHEGQTSGWTRVKASGKGLSGTIGPFSVGEWYFALVGITSESEPSSCPNVTYTLNGDTVTWGGYANTSVRYIGISGTQGYTTKVNVTLEGNQSTTYIPMSLQQVNMTSKVTVKLDGLQLVGSSGISKDSKVWLKVYKGEEQLGDTIEVTAGASGAFVPTDTSREFTIDGAVQVTLNFKLYDKEDNNAPVVKEASVSFLATKGATVTLAGSLDAIEVYGSFDPDNFEAYVVSSTGKVTFENTLADAITTAQAGDTIKLLKDITVDGVVINKSITIDGNGKKITQSGTSTTRWFVLVEPTSSSDITANLKNLKVESVYGNISTHSAFAVLYDSSAEYKTTGTVENCTITGPSVGLASAGSPISSNHTFNGSEVTVINSTISSTGNNTNDHGIYNAALSPQMGGVINVISGSFDGIWSIAEYTSMGRINIEGGSFSGPILVYGDAGYTDYSSNENNSPFHLVKVSGSENPTFDLTMKTAEDSKYTAVSSIENYASGFVFKGTTTNDPNKLTLSCGTYSVDPSAYVAAGYEAKPNTPSEGKWTVSQITDGVASVERNGNEIQFATLQGAIDYAVSGETVKILKNINLASTTDSGFVLTIDKSITVDGNSKSLTIDRSENPRVANGLLIGSASSTSSDDVNVTMHNLNLAFKGCKYGLTAEDEGTGNETVILKDMVITSDEGAPVVVGDSVVLKGQTSIQNNKILNVSGSFVQSDTIPGNGTWFYAGVAVWGGASLTVESGVSISGPVGIEIMNSGGTVTVKDGATVTSIGNNTNGFTEDNYMFGNALYCDSNGVMLVQGGTFTVELDQTTNNQGLKVAGTGSISITGGVFNMKMDPNTFVASGYHAIEDPSGTWTVSAE